MLAKDVVCRGNDLIATSSEPWLEVGGIEIESLAGHLVEIVYRASYWDVPARPVFRFETARRQRIDRIGPAPVAGSAIWIGRIPKGTRQISVSPTDEEGPFAFEIESIRRRNWFSLAGRGLLHAPRPLLSALLTRLIGWREEADSNLSWAVGTTRLSSYGAWQRRRGRAPLLNGIDAPRSAWDDADPIHLWVRTTSDPALLRRTLTSALRQVFPRWVLHVHGEAPADLPADPRIRCDRNVSATAERAGLMTSLHAGDELLPHALAAVHEASRRHPEADLFYGDEEIELPSGQVVPYFRPGWSPLLNEQRPFLGRGIFLRAQSPHLMPRHRDQFVRDAVVAPAVLAALRDKIVPLHRMLLRTHDQQTGSGRTRIPSAAPGGGASVAVIIPTKDQATRLARLLASVDRHSANSPPQLIIVDNDSIETSTRSLFDGLRDRDRLTIVDHPGAFNFSSMCNAGAAATAADVLVFLNNDMEVISDDWLEPLKAWALQDHVGAVGAKLTYPDGRLQHIGVLLGMGGSAGHFASLALADAAGWMGRNEVAHEVSAVTGACLAVEAQKFRAVGGFDAVNLPVELSDIDLCLRLADRGWAAIVDPHVHLMHEESTSRGRATFRRLSTYQDEREYFISRWKHVLRNDPYFHPGLSLFDRTLALG